MSARTAFLLRLNEELLEAIRKSADENERSINKEIEFILKTYARQNGYLED